VLDHTGSSPGSLGHVVIYDRQDLIQVTREPTRALPVQKDAILPKDISDRGFYFAGNWDRAGKRSARLPLPSDSARSCCASDEADEPSLEKIPDIRAAKEDRIMRGGIPSAKNR
jgi:hypothetical protein